MDHEFGVVREFKPDDIQEVPGSIGSDCEYSPQYEMCVMGRSEFESRAVNTLMGAKLGAIRCVRSVLVT